MRLGFSAGEGKGETEGGIAIALIFSLSLFTFPLSPVEASNDPSHLVVWAMGEEGKKIAQMARKFEAANPGVTVETQAIPWDAAHAKLLTAVVGGIPPDVSQMGTTWMAEFAAMKALAPVTDLAARSATAAPRSFFPGSLQTCVVDNVMYGVPWYVDTRVLFYRKDLLAGVGFPRPPATWDELKTAAGRLAARPGPDGKKLYGIAFGARSWNDLLMAVWQNGGDPLRPSAPEFAEAMRHYAGFFRDGMTPSKEAADVDLFHAFKTGYLPMFVSGPWMVDLTHKELPELEGKWGVSVLPGRKSRTSFVGGCNFVIFKDSPRQALAWKFLEFMSDPDVQAEWYRLTTDLPSSRDAWDRPVLRSQGMIAVFGDQMKDTASPPTIPEWEQIARAIEDAMERIVLNPAEDAVMREKLLKLEGEILRIRAQGDPAPQSWKPFAWTAAAAAALLAAVLFRRSRRAKGGTSPVRFLTGLPGMLFVLPALIILSVFTFLPLAVSFLMSLTDLNILSLNQWDLIRFVGAQNYLKTLHDPLFWKSLGNSLYFAGVGVPVTIAVSLAAAVALNQKSVWWKPLFRVAFFAPVVTTIVAVAVVWRWLYNPEFGPFNWFLHCLGFEPLNWLSDPKTAMPSLILMAIWKNFGYNMVIFLAGLQTIPETQYEAARIDGASPWQCFRYVTLPGLAPTMVLVLVLTTVGYVQFFAEPYVMTKGGPLNSTMSIVLYMYDQGFRFFNLGYASAISYALFGLIFAFALVQMKLKKSGLGESA